MSNRNIWIEDDYIFRATSSGVDIYDLSTTSQVAIVYYAGGMNSVWANSDYLLMGTTNSGIVRLPISTISGSYDLTNQLSIYKAYPDITNNNVNYLHGKGNYLCATTVSGVDQINLTTGSGIYTTVLGAGKCYQTTSGRFYYDLGTSLNAMYNIGSNWSSPDYSYVAGDIIPDVTINDIYVTEGTSVYSSTDNVIFLATTSGVVMIEERQGDESNSRFKYFYKSEA